MFCCCEGQKIEYVDIFRRSKNKSENNFDYIIYLIRMNVLLVYSVILYSKLIYQESILSKKHYVFFQNPVFQTIS